METTKSTKVISQVFEEFLADQKVRVSAKTYSSYASMIQLYEMYLENYWPGHDDEHDKVTNAGGTYCDTFPAQDATDGFFEFLGYFMPRKVSCGKETMRAAGTVTKMLAKWLAQKGYIENTDDAQEYARIAAKKLPNSLDVLELLADYCDLHAPGDFDQDIQDDFWIERIEPGQLWLSPATSPIEQIGPISVPEQVTDHLKLDWTISGTAAKVGKTWTLVEVWRVSP